MKKILVIRHAKSSWDFLSLDDFERTLNERGHKDAPAMAKRLIDKKIHIDAFISSTAVRALTTATYFAEAYGLQQADIIKIPELYHAAPAVFYDVITKADNTLNTIAIFSHNPGITEFANQLTSTKIDDMPTCAVFAATIESNQWSDFASAKKSYWFFDYPKNA